MKSSENCFREIINSVHNLKKEKDNGDSKYKSIISWSKCRNFKGVDYYLEGTIKIDDKGIGDDEKSISMYYFLSNKRSCLYLIKEDIEPDINKLQYYLLLYTEALFKTYSIDIFINNLVNTN